MGLWVVERPVVWQANKKNKGGLIWQFSFKNFRQLIDNRPCRHEINYWPKIASNLFISRLGTNAGSKGRVTD